MAETLDYLWRLVGEPLRTAPDLTRVVWCGKEQRLVLGWLKQGLTDGLRLKRSSHNRFHHLVKTFWDWYDQQLADSTDIQRLAAETLLDPTDVWRQQPDMAALLDDEYQSVDPAKVTAAAQQLVTEKPHLARPQNAPPPTDRPIEGLRRGASPDVTRRHRHGRTLLGATPVTAARI